jgi:hypothetical protein
MALNIPLSHSSNGNGGGAINGRGLRHRKMTRSDAVQLAADIASGRPFVPSLHHLADIFGIPVGSLSKAMKARAAAQEALAEEVPAGEVFAEGASAEIETSMERVEKLAFAWLNLDMREREDFVRVIGVDAVWDVIARLIR